MNYAYLIPPVKPNEGARESFRKNIERFVYKMSLDTSTQVFRLANKYDYDLSSADFAADIASILSTQENKWEKKAVEDDFFYYAPQFTREIVSSSVNSLYRNISNTVPKEMTPPKWQFEQGHGVVEMQKVIKQQFDESSKSLANIVRKYHEDLSKSVRKNFYSENAKKDLTNDLEKGYSVAHGRAKVVSGALSGVASNAAARAISIGNGYTEAVWIHTGRSKVPRPSHVAANGKVFNLNQGLMIDGEYIYPGEAYNCTCEFSLIIRG